MARYAHVVDEVVVNVIEWDGAAPMEIEGGLVESDAFDIGDEYAGDLEFPPDPEQ